MWVDGGPQTNKEDVPGTVEDCLFAFPLAIGERPLSRTAP